MIGWTRIVIEDEAYRGLFSHPLPGHRFVNDGQRLADGRWSISIHRETEARLKAAAFKGETVSDTIIRLLAFARSGGKLS